MVIVTSHAVETAAPLRRQQRRSRFLFLLTIPICFSILSLLKQAPLDNSPDSAVIVPEKKDDAEHSESDSESCLRPRSNNRDAVVKSPMKLPIINLGMPKMGSTSLHSYFDCGGYKSVHWRCGERYCSECIREAIQAGLPPFSKCNITDIDSYAQIDRGPENLVQVNNLNEIVGGVPNATFILTFRNMTKWYMSMSNWWTDSKEVPFNSTKDNTMRGRFEVANITGLPVGVGRNVSEFSHFYCEYVKRVREEVAKYPGRHELIEIDIEDPTVGRQMEEAFGVNRTCWGHSNTGNHNDAVPADELQ
mmetsp:Transcript_24435/g.37385  ORF Transcript_24435/g.37385 Transcript_24435/m.37385 type:complete len:305 (-) Transcript_24435:275-1189(-)